MVPMARLAQRAAASLVRGQSLLSGDGKELLAGELVDGLATRFTSYGAKGREALEAVLPNASAETAFTLWAVLAAIPP
jgi:hypothetical protein